jgi:general secretion pathway protein D
VPVVAGDSIVTQLIPLQYIDANDMAEIVRNFLSSVGSPIPYAPTNTLILTDYASNINRILRIIRELDTDTYKQIIEVIPLQYASASVMAQLLTNLFQQVGGGGVSKTRAVRGPGVPPPTAAQVPTKIIAEERTNSLIVVATVEDLMAMKNLIIAGFFNAMLDDNEPGKFSKLQFAF